MTITKILLMLTVLSLFYGGIAPERYYKQCLSYCTDAACVDRCEAASGR